MQHKSSVSDGGEKWNDLGTKIVEKVAQTNGVDPLDLEPLQQTVDVDALTELCAHPGTDVDIIFEYEEHRVTVGSDGQVRLDT